MTIKDQKSGSSEPLRSDCGGFGVYKDDMTKRPDNSEKDSIMNRSTQPPPGKFKRLTICAALLLGLSTAGTSFAATSIAVNFQGRNETTQVGTTPMAPTEVAGVVPQANWNNVDDNAVNNNGTTPALKDSNGNATSVTLTFLANDSWSNDTNPNSITTGDAHMMNGIMKCTTAGNQTLTWNNLNDSSTYDVYLYVNQNGDNSQVYVSESTLGTTYYLTLTHLFPDGTRFIKATNTDGSAYPLANYIKFEGLQPSGGTIQLVLTHVANSDGAGIGGIQLITPSGDTPVQILTQPLSQTNAVGNSVTFGVFAYGDNQQFQWFKNGSPIPGANSSSYSTPALTAADSGATYHVVVSNGANSVTSADATLTVKPATVVQNALRREHYPGFTRSDLQNGVAGYPTIIEAIPSFSTVVNNGVNNWVEKVSGFFTPDTSGNYVFFVSSDDDSDFYISTDTDPANKQLVAQETAWSNPLEWTISGGNSSLTQKRSDQFSPDQGATTPFATGIPLTGGTSYYIEGLHHQGTGGDNFSVTYKLLDDPDPVSPDTVNLIPGDATKLTNSVISFNTTTTTTLSIAQQPQDQTITEGFAANFNVGIDTDSELTPKFQWKRNGVDIPGATSRAYAPIVTAADQGAKYSVQVSIPGFATSVTSTEATLTVRTPVFTGGFLKYELWQGDDDNGHKTRPDIEAGNGGPQTTVTAISTLQTPFHSAEPNNYADRISGFFIPKTSGNYVFFIGSDDSSDLFLSTDDTAANKKLIAKETVWSNSEEWTISAGNSDLTAKRSDTFATNQWPTGNTITLTANQRYYIEVVHEEGGGGDWVGVYAKLESDPDPVNVTTPSNLSGDLIGFLVAPSTVTITQQPVAATTTEGFPATFSVAATTDSQINQISYQWKKNGVDIPGANSATYTTPAVVMSYNNAKYTVEVNAPGATQVTSSEAVLTVQPGVLVTGFIKYQEWDGKVRADVENGTAGAPTMTSALPILQIPSSAIDNFADRFSGYFIPDQTGSYTLFVGGDDDADLFLSTNDDPANKKLIAQETAYSGFQTWLTAGSGDPATKNSLTFINTQWPGGNDIQLTAGQKYYIEVVHHDGAQGDWSGVYAATPDGAEYPADGVPSNLTGARIATFVHPATVTITQQPANATTVEGYSATYTVAATGTGDFNVFSYQWQRNGVDIPGATGATYKTAPLTQANATDKYSVKVSTPGSDFVTSSQAGVTIGTAAFTTGIVKHEVWNGITDRALVETDAAGEPSYVEALTSFSTPYNAGEPSNYSDRISGIFTPAVSGNYVFFLGSDDDSDLFLSPDSDPANKVLIAQEFGYSGANSWNTIGGNGSLATDKRSDQSSVNAWPGAPTISLTAGHQYYMEIVHHEGGGGDWAGAYFTLSGAADPADGTPSNLTGSLIGAVGPGQPSTGAELAISASAGSITISWTGAGTLQQASQLTGNPTDWSNVTPAPTGTSYTINNPSGNLFFRVAQ
jgi:hypothetical protein